MLNRIVKNDFLKDINNLKGIHPLYKQILNWFGIEPCSDLLWKLTLTRRWLSAEGVWICMIRDARFWFFTISYCILCCRNRLMVFINSLEESRPRAGLVMTWSRQKGPTLLWLISKCVFANIGDYSPGTESQSRHSNGISGLYLVLMETSDNTEVFTDFSQSLESGFSP